MFFVNRGYSIPVRSSKICNNISVASTLKFPFRSGTEVITIMRMASQVKHTGTGIIGYCRAILGCRS